jgi:hypothetical protein
MHLQDVHVDEEELRELMCRERSERMTPESTFISQQQPSTSGAAGCPSGQTCSHPHHQRKCPEKKDSFKSAPPSRQQSFALREAM